MKTPNDKTQRGPSSRFEPKYQLHQAERIGEQNYETPSDQHSSHSDDELFVGPPLMLATIGSSGLRIHDNICIATLYSERAHEFLGGVAFSKEFSDERVLSRLTSLQSLVSSISEDEVRSFIRSQETARSGNGHGCATSVRLSEDPGYFFEEARLARLAIVDCSGIQVIEHVHLTYVVDKDSWETLACLALPESVYDSRLRSIIDARAVAQRLVETTLRRSQSRLVARTERALGPVDDFQSEVTAERKSPQLR